MAAETEALGHALAGGAASVLSLSLLYPLDNLRTRLQVAKTAGDVVSSESDGSTQSAPTPQATQKAPPSTRELARQVLAEEGIGGFYTGLSSGLKAFGLSWFTYYFLFNYLSDLARARKGVQKLSNVMNLITAAQAGTIVCVLMEPIWVVNTRAKLAKGEEKGVFAEIFKIWREEGIGALFGGLAPSLVLVSNPSIQFMVAEFVKEKSVTAQVHMTPFHHFLNGAVSKLVATIITYPYQVLKTRLQRKENTDNIFWCAVRVVQENGWAGLYRGISMKISQTVLTSAFMFFFYSIFVQKTMLLLAFTQRLRRKGWRGAFVTLSRLAAVSFLKLVGSQP